MALLERTVLADPGLHRTGRAPTFSRNVCSCGVIPGRGGSAPRIGVDSYRPPNASAIRTASSFLTSASGRGWSTGKCSDPLVDV